MYTLITGASSGIGLELAKIFAKNNHDLILVARRKEKLDALAQELSAAHNVKVEILTKDLSLPHAAREVHDEVKAKNLEVDILVNNAGFGGLGKFHEREWKQEHAMIQLNVITLTALTHHFLPDFVKRDSGKILNVSSTASLMPGPLQAVYYATKAYVASFSNAIAEELSDTQITVTNLMPGATKTEFGSTSGMDKTSLFKKTASAESVAQDAYNGLMTGKLDVISGLTFSQKILTKLIPFVPKKIILKQISEMQDV